METPQGIELCIPEHHNTKGFFFTGLNVTGQFESKFTVLTPKPHHKNNLAWNTVNTKKLPKTPMSMLKT